MGSCQARVLVRVPRGGISIIRLFVFHSKGAENTRFATLTVVCR